MAEFNRRRAARGRAGSPEFFCLVFVLAAGVVTAAWAGHRIGLEFSSLNTSLNALATIVGLNYHDMPIEAVGHDPNQPAAGVTVLRDGQAPPVRPGVPGRADSQAGEAAEPWSAPYCEAGQQPAFVLGLADLKARLGDAMGDPVECEHPASADGDTIQRTTTGLAAYRKATNTVVFTNGWQHWALTPRGVVTWQGDQTDPPATAQLVGGGPQ